MRQSGELVLAADDGVDDSLPGVHSFRRPPGLPITCSDADLLQAVKASLCGAEPEELAPLLRVPKHAVQHWIGTPEWNEIKEFVLPELRAGVHTRLFGIRSKCLVQLAERIDKGDPHLGPGGELLGYVPVKARDLANILTKTSQVIHDLEAEVGNIRDDKGNISLKELAEGLRNYAKAKDVTSTAKRLDG